MNDQGISETRFRVRYAETDQMGVVYHSNYLIWFEIGRVEMMRELGFDYKHMEIEDGCFISVVDARCRFKSPALYDDLILVRTHINRMRETMVHFSYEVFRDGDKTILCEGETTHISTGRDFKIKKMPEKYVAAFREAMRRHRAASQTEGTLVL